MANTRNTMRFICVDLNSQKDKWCGKYHMSLETASKHVDKIGWSIRKVDSYQHRMEILRRVSLRK